MRCGEGQPRKLLVQANRNGFFYVLDRTNGKFLLGKQYVKYVTWASGLTAEGRPIVVPNMEPTSEGKRVCPSLDGASNWYSTSFNPMTNLYYVQTQDKCGIFTRTDSDWEAGKGFMGGSFGPAPEAAAARAAGDRHPYRQGCVGAAAIGDRQFVGRRAQHGRRHRDLR